MSKDKRKIASVLVFVFSLFSIINYLPGQASAKTSSKVQTAISGVAYKYSAGDKAVMKLTSSTTSTVQYRVFVKNSYEKAPVDITKGYTKAVKGKSLFTIALPTSKVGVNTVTVYVKNAGSKAKYDSYKRVVYSVVKVQATISGIASKYNLGDKATVKLAAVNAGVATVQYRLFVKNSNEKTPVEVTKGYTKLVKPNAPYAITLPTSKEGLNTVTVYVRRAGSKASYDNYRRIQYTVVNITTSVVLDNEGVVYGSSDAKNPLSMKKDIYVSANNIILSNLNVDGTIYINPGKDGNADLNNVKAKDIKVLSGGEHSIHFNNVSSPTLEVSSDSKVRIETKGTTNIENTTVTSYAVFDSNGGSLGEIKVAKNDKGEYTVEFHGIFIEPIVVEASATIKTDAQTSIPKLEVATTVSTDKVTLDGNFQSVSVTKAAQLVVGANAKVTDTIKVMAAVELKSADNANIAKVDVAVTDPNATVKFEGKTFTNVEVNSTAKIVIPEGTKVNATVNVKGANIEVAKGADVKVDAKGNDVKVTGDGSKDVVVTNPSQETSPGGGGISPPPAKTQTQIIADGITTIEQPERGATTLILPSVPAGYSISIKSSSKLGVIALNGTITPPNSDELVSVVLTVSKVGASETADTRALSVLVPGTVMSKEALDNLITKAVNEANTYNAIKNRGTLSFNNGTIELKLNSDYSTNYKNETISSIFDNLKVIDITESQIMPLVNLIAPLVTSNDAKIGNTDFRQYIIDKLNAKGHADLANDIQNLNASNYITIKPLIDRLKNISDFNALLDIVKDIIGSDEAVTIANAKVFGLTVNSIKIGEITIYSGSDNTISIPEIKHELGLDSVDTGDIKLTNLNKPITIDLGGYIYTLSIK